jgi:hypothetical protein
MAERRSAVMIVADAWWEEPDGSLQKGRARIVNKSLSGACVRFEKQIEVGAKLRIESHWDEFCGVAKYCRKEGKGYLVGIQRQIGVNSIPKQTAESLRDNRRRQETTFEERRVADNVDRQRQEQVAPEPRMPESAANRDDTVRHENVTGGRLPDDHPTGEEKEKSTRIAEFRASAPQNEAIAEVAAEVLAPKVGYRKSSGRRWDRSQQEGVHSQQWWEARATLLLKQREAQEEVHKERGTRAMEINWMGRGKRGAGDGNENGNASSGGADERNKPAGADSGGAGERNKPLDAGGDTGEKSKAVAPVFAALPRKARVAAAVDGDLIYQNELLPLEEIYVAAGVVSPRRGYSIKKVMEMLHSEHLSSLSKEMRRASVMMALDAAGVSVEEVLRDAQVRLDAIKAYGADQKQLCEAEWARKAEEHAQLKAELEQVRARFMERMKQTLDGIARDRARFGTWLTTIREEAESIADAVELCTKAAPPVADNAAPGVDEVKEARLKVV